MAEALIGIGEHAERRPQRLGIERPALDEGGVAAEAHEGGKRLILLGEADLEMVSRRFFVEVELLHALGRPRRRFVVIIIEYVWTIAVVCASLFAFAPPLLLLSSPLRLSSSFY